MNCRIWERFKMPRLTEMVSLMISTMATTAGYGRGPYTALHMFPMLPITVNISLFKTNIWSMSDFTYTNYQNQDQCKKNIHACGKFNKWQVFVYISYRTFPLRF